MSPRHVPDIITDTSARFGVSRPPCSDCRKLKAADAEIESLRGGKQALTDVLSIAHGENADLQLIVTDAANALYCAETHESILSAIDDLDKALAERDEANNRADRLAEVLREARRQIEYLHDKFQATGSGAAVLARIELALEDSADA